MSAPNEASIVIVKLACLVLAVTNRKYGGLGLPGGKVEEGETPYEAAVRELKEETGLLALTTDLVFLTRGKSSTSDRIVHVHYAMRVSAGRAPNEPGTELLWVKWQEILDNSPFKVFYSLHFPQGVDHLIHTKNSEELVLRDQKR